MLQLQITQETRQHMEALASFSMRALFDSSSAVVDTQRLHEPTSSLEPVGDTTLSQLEALQVVTADPSACSKYLSAVVVRGSQANRGSPRV